MSDEAREGLAVQEDPLIGRVLDGRYRIVSKVARGGMATVYEAHDQRLDRTVAVKVMHPGMGDDQAFAARFVREARSAARLTHPNVVAVYDQGDDHGTVFLAMELVPGQTMRDLVTRETPMAPRRAMQLLEPVVSALAAAHQAGLVHRDIKPENVLIARDGAIKVADFGLARAVSTESRHTATGALMGTVSYLAPELLTDGVSDARVDVYAAGVMMYELLTGHKPHSAETPVAVAYKHVHEDVPSPSLEVPGIPDYVDALVARATARKPERRPRDGGELLELLRAVSSALASGVRNDPELATAIAGRPGAPVILDETAVFDHGSLVPRHAANDTRPVHASTGHIPRLPASPQARRRRGLFFGGLALLVVLAIVIGLWVNAAKYTHVPDLTGMDPDTAQAELEKHDLTLETGDDVYSDIIEKGQIAETDPGLDERVRKGSAVTVHVSLGIEEYLIPDLKGRTPEQAATELGQIHMLVGGPQTEWSLDVPAGQVIRTDPAGGTTQRPNTTVVVYLSEGPQPVQIPDLTGKVADEAIAALQALGVTVDTSTREYSDTYTKDFVIRTEPGPGEAHQGDTIKLILSDGPETFALPDMRNKSADDAEAALEALGLVVKREKSPYYLGFDRVGGTDPDPGAMVKRGQTVTLKLV